MTDKRCSACREWKPLAAFCANRAQPDGRANQCKPCHAAANGTYKDKTPRRQFSTSLRRALLRRPTESPATVDHLMDLWRLQGGRCALSGMPMVFRQGAVLGQSISLDRIDQSKGYEPGNIRLICHAVNCFRGSMTDAEMMTFADALVKTNAARNILRGSTAFVEERRYSSGEARTLAA